MVRFLLLIDWLWQAYKKALKGKKCTDMSKDLLPLICSQLDRYFLGLDIFRSNISEAFRIRFIFKSKYSEIWFIKIKYCYKWLRKFDSSAAIYKLSQYATFVINMTLNYPLFVIKFIEKGLMRSLWKSNTYVMLSTHSISNNFVCLSFSLMFT